MTTFKEAVYMVLDLLKQVADDAYYTEEHIMFLLSNARAALISKKYHYSRNQSFVEVDKANYQYIQYQLEQEPRSGCEYGIWYKGADKAVPKLHTVGYPKAFENINLRNEFISVVPPERLPFVGYNKWLRHNIYCSISNDNTLYVRQLEHCHGSLASVYLYAIFENALESTPMSADPVDTGVSELIDRRFPLEESLMTDCINAVVQELTGMKFQPEDRNNNGKDDMSDMSVQKNNQRQTSNE